MFRNVLLALLLAGSACADPPPPAVPVLPVPVAPAPGPGVPPPAPQAPADPLSGNLGGKPFTARSALLVQPNSLTTRCFNDGSNKERCEENVPVSFIRILDRVVTCADLVGPGERPDVQFSPGERYIEMVLQAAWPVASGTTLSTDATMSSPRRDHFTASFKDGWASGAIAKGTARFMTNGTRATVTIDLQTTNPSLPTSGRATGSIELVTCPLDHPRRGR